MRRILLPLLATLALAAAAAVLSACSDSTEPETPATGRLVLRLTDAACGYDEVNVEVAGVSVHRAGDDIDEGAWVQVSDDTFSVDLLTLSGGRSVVVADTLLTAGKYTQVRLHLTGGNTVVVGGASHGLTVPSAEQSGLALNHPFTLEPDVTYAATLDFDACRSVHEANDGTYVLRPVIRLVVDATSGGLRGTVLPAGARAHVWAVSGGDSALAVADTLTGDYLLATLAEGTYDVSFVPTAEGYADSTMSDVTVVAGQVTDLVTVELQPAP